MDEGGSKMKTYKIAVIPGDGVGPEVLTEGMKVLKRVAELDGTFQIEDTWFPWGCEYYLKTGRMMPEDGIEILAKYDAILLGAVGYPGVPDNVPLHVRADPRICAGHRRAADRQSAGGNMVRVSAS
jgi:tartrate dehydrogenase/decarboxylase/D-malate dehydrogenase